MFKKGGGFNFLVWYCSDEQRVRWWCRHSRRNKNDNNLQTKVESRRRRRRSQQTAKVTPPCEPISAADERRTRASPNLNESSLFKTPALSFLVFSNRAPRAVAPRDESKQGQGVRGVGDAGAKRSRLKTRRQSEWHSLGVGL